MVHVCSLFFFYKCSIHLPQLYRDTRQCSRCFRPLLANALWLRHDLHLPTKLPPDMLKGNLFNHIISKNTCFSFSIMLSLKCRHENTLMYSNIWKRGGAGEGPAGSLKSDMSRQIVLPLVTPLRQIYYFPGHFLFSFTFLHCSSI